MSLKKELYRKSIHIASSVIPLLYLFTSKSLALRILIPCMVLLILIDIVRLNIPLFNSFYLKFLKDILRIKEGQRFTGATYLLVSSVGVILLYDKGIAISCLLFLTISDSVAAIAGMRFGRIRFYNKSLEGSFAFLISSIIIISLIESVDYTTGICGAFTATFVEASVKVMDDNLSIPVISGLIMQLVSSFLI